MDIAYDQIHGRIVALDMDGVTVKIFNELTEVLEHEIKLDARVISISTAVPEKIVGKDIIYVLYYSITLIMIYIESHLKYICNKK